MKILIYSDVHISQDSSIVKSLGSKYSVRLEHIIDSISWAESLANIEKCDAIFNLGDTFDKPFINSMEATAIQDIGWSHLPHFVLVGNHDSNVASLEYSSVSVLKKLNFNIISKPTTLTLPEKDGSLVNFTFLPYISESDRKDLKDYLKVNDSIILSHNDISGYSYGPFISKTGFPLKDIESNCRLFLNGHLHNSSFLSKKVLNVGNLCGQNFSEDAFTYKHGCWILDTETCGLKFYENPDALNFYKIEYKPLDSKLFDVKNNSVLMIKCERSNQESLKKDLDSIKHKIIATRVLLYDNEVVSSIDTSIKLEKVDHLKQFTDFILEKLGNTELVNSELSEVCK